LRHGIQMRAVARVAFPGGIGRVMGMRIADHTMGEKAERRSEPA
jgi:hypothetical protein